LTHSQIHVSDAASFEVASNCFTLITIELQVDNIFNMDETFILVYPGKDKVLLQKGPWFQLKKTKRESHWQSQLVFFLHNFFPPFIIDPGSFGADLMTSWS